MDFPLDAQVHCADGPFGQLTAVIVDPATEKVGYVAVRDATEPHPTYLVSADFVINISPDLIQLSCTQGELATFEPFTETEYVEVWAPYYTDELGYNYTGPQMVAVERQLLPPGTLAVSRDMAVEATDGFVGTVDELVVDPTSGHVTHFVLSKGHLWGEAEVTLPVSQVERVERSTIYLKLDKKSITLMPAVQARRLYSKEEINVMEIELVVVTFDDVGKAGQAQQILKGLDESGVTEIRDVAVLVKEQDGKTSLRESADLDAKQGALFGAIVGGLVGLLGGPAGVVLGAAAGAATGRVAADKIDRGFSDAYLKRVQDALQPGSSALVTLVEKRSVEKVADALKDLDGHLVQQTLTDNVVKQLLTDQGGSRAGDDLQGEGEA